MPVGPRVTLQPIPMNLSALSVTPGWIVSTTPGYDLGSPSAITAWSGQGGVMIPNPGGNVILAWACGATAAGVTQILVGDVIGATGLVAPATSEQVTIASNTSGWFGPFSPATFNQQAPTTVAYTGMINSTALTSAAQGCVVIDFTTTTSLAVRALSLIPVQP